MRYMGGKTKLSKKIAPFINEAMAKNGITNYVELFVGGNNIVDKVIGANSIQLNDFSPIVFNLWNGCKQGFEPSKAFDLKSYDDYIRIVEPEYKKMLAGSSELPLQLQAYINLACSFSGKLNGGFARSKDNNVYYANGFKSYNKVKNILRLETTSITNSSYENVPLQGRSVLYLDPPYKDTTGYTTGKFDHDKFWSWCEEQVKCNHVLLISEQQAPSGWVDVMNVNFVRGMRDASKEKIIANEKLFVHKTQLESVMPNQLIESGY